MINIFHIENNRVKEDTAKQIKYLLEDKFQLEREVRAGEEAKKELKKVEGKLKANMVLYASFGGNDNEWLKKEINHVY